MPGAGTAACAVKAAARAAAGEVQAASAVAGACSASQRCALLYAQQIAVTMRNANHNGRS